MKILAIVPSYRHGADAPMRFICELTSLEMDLVSGLTKRMDYTSVQEVEICNKYQHAMNVVNKCHEAAKIPGTLRAIADMMAIVVPAIEEVAKEETEVKFDE